MQGLPKRFHRPGVGAGNVEPGAGSAARLGADDPGVDERRAGGLDLGPTDSRPAPPRHPARPERPILMAPRHMPRRRAAGSLQSRIALLHAVTHIELNAIDLAWDIIARFTAEDLPRAFYDDWVGVAAEEAAHFSLLSRRLAALGAAYGDLPAHGGLWEAAENTADDLAARLAVVEETGGKNLAAKRRQLRLYMKPFFGTQLLDTITTFTVDRYKKLRSDAGATNGTINRELATLSHLFNRAVDWRWVKALPCRVKKLDEDAGRIVVLSDKQADALLKAAIADQDAYCWLFVAFGLNTAMRHSEILRSRFDQLDLDHNRLFIPQAKAGVREQPITPELTDILRTERDSADDQDGWIFPSPCPNASLTGHRDRMDKPYRRAVISAGLDPTLVTPHVMRHTAITNLVQAGVDLPTIQRISGHKTLAMVLRYTHVHGTHIDQAIKAIGRGIPEPSPNETSDTATQELHTLSKRPA